MTVVDTRMSVWEALAGRAPGRPVGPADPGLWSAVAERLNPVRAKPVLRLGIEASELVSARGAPYVMLRSPDKADACYLRLSPEEWQLAGLMDGTRTVARLVAEFTRICGRLAPDQVTRVVADLAGSRMLAELPVNAFHRVERLRRRPWPLRLGRGILAALQGRRVVLASIDPLVGFLYKAGARILFTRVGAVLCALVALAGLGLFGLAWARGDKSVFLTGDSYVTGALVLLGLNVVALACHELGHALATKHAKRRVPAAGFLIYFGIPSVFVDTTDVWMAGRKARLVTTAAGPASGLVLAGIAQIVGMLYPPAAPWAFKLAFAWYLNALFNLNPFLALDGYYLLMDALEVPNLRARGLAWVGARIRRRPPKFGQLDREGRLVAIYGMLALVWLVIAGNLAYRIYTDRVSGLVVGLWRGGWPARALLAAVVAGLMTPVVYVMSGWLARRWRNLRARLAERRTSADAPRRLTALRESTLGNLPPPALSRLAGAARWVRPRNGEQLVFAGAAQADVYVVVEGAMEGRRPGDPPGYVRQRVGAGGVVGIASALTGAPAALAWHTAGTKLLAVPAGAVAAAVGPIAGPPPAERAELEALFAETPALAGLSPEDAVALVARARPGSLAPGAPVLLPGPYDAVVVCSGAVVTPDGTQWRRGALLGPVGEGPPGAVAVARAPTRTWTLPALAGLPLLLGAPPRALAAGVRAPTYGVHPPAAYPPLAAPPGPPPPVDNSVDRRFERRLWWLLILLLLFALLLTGTNLLPGPAWAEMPTDRALLTVQRGTVTATVDGDALRLRAGDKVYIGQSDVVTVADRRSSADVTFRGGAVAVLCAGTQVEVGDLRSEPAEPIRPTGAVTLARGRMLVDTATASAAFAPLALTLSTGAGDVVNDGAARYTAEPGDTDASAGTVALGGVVLAATGADLTCGDGVSLPRGGEPSTEPSAEPSLTPSPSDSASPSASASASAGASPSRPGASTRPPTPGVRPSTGPVNRPPTITFVERQLYGRTAVQRIPGENGGQPFPCQSSPSDTVFPVVAVTDDRDPPGSGTVTVKWSGFSSGSSAAIWDAPNWYGFAGPVNYPGRPNEGGSIRITVTATDSQGASTTVTGPYDVLVLKCDHDPS